MKQTLAWLLYKIGLSANFLTFLGLLTACVSGFLIFEGRFFLAGAVLLLSGFFDLMDGAVARLSGEASPFGGILDSSLDRYGDAVVMGGILFYFISFENYLYALLSFSALLGSFEISYVRARAECEMESCRVGFWERGERIVYVALGLLLNNLAPVLWVLAFGTHWTAFQRLRLAKLGNQGLTSATSRKSALYFAKVVLLILAVIFLKNPA